MTSEFPTLAEVIAEHGCDRTAQHAVTAADAWREACTIRTVEQLAALPHLAIVQDADGAAWTKDTESVLAADYGPWFVCGFEVPAHTVDLPARLLWHPEWTYVCTPCLQGLVP